MNGKDEEQEYFFTGRGVGRSEVNGAEVSSALCGWMKRNERSS